MRIYILGISGTFMAGIACMAKQLGHQVAGCDAAVYPPMSTLLHKKGIDVDQGYEERLITPTPDCFIIGNALSRGAPLIEQIMAGTIPYYSGPQWLRMQVLKTRHVAAVAGTHGKTTTASMLTWILSRAGLDPGYLIGGMAHNFDESASIGAQKSGFFVVEADEYDTAFFDKRPKFLHYRPDTLILNNLEFDHADIYENIGQIEKQFHYLIRSLSPNARIIVNGCDAHLEKVLEKGFWSKISYFYDTPSCPLSRPKSSWWFCNNDDNTIEIFCDEKSQGVLSWSLWGDHMSSNAVAAIAAASNMGIEPADAITALASFSSVSRRMECVFRWKQKGAFYDDFAHHPTAIRANIKAVKDQMGSTTRCRVLCICELSSYTMRTGVHFNQVKQALGLADKAWIFDPARSLDQAKDAAIGSYWDMNALTEKVCASLLAGDQLLLFSNSARSGLKDKLKSAIAQKIF